MPKDKKSKKADKKSRTAEKQNKSATKAKQKERKAQKKVGSADSDAEDIDLDEVLAEYARQQAQFLKVSETSVPDPPSARASSTLIASPSSKNEVFLFGGEHYNGALAVFYNDLYIYQINHDVWRHVTSPNTPLPRSGHAWTRGGNDAAIYLFGGEFSSPKQGTFYHYNDLWRLDPNTREWSKLDPKGKGPPARSGHRMTYWKNFIILFAGFQDTSSTTKYLDDLWLYDTQTFVWHSPKLPPVSQKPDARSSFSFLPNETGAALFGGYSRMKGFAKGKHIKGGQSAQRTVLRPVIHQDNWFLRISVSSEANQAQSLPMVRWERRRRSVNLPNPARAGATMAFHKGRGVLFGGVHDVEESEEGIDSEFFNELFTWNIDRNRWFKSTLRKQRTSQKGPNRSDIGGRQRGRAKADEEDLLRNLAALETGTGISNADKMDIDLSSDEEEQTSKIEKPVSFELPHPRFNVQITVQGDILLLYGGTYEKGDREYTFDDLYAIDLGKLDGVRELFKREIEDWVGSDDEMSDDEDEDSDEDGSDMEDQGLDGVSVQDDAESTVGTSIGHGSVVTSITEPDEPMIIEEEISVIDQTRHLPHPRPFESLRDFHARTVIQWQEVILEEMRTAGASSAAVQGVKELRKKAFGRAEERYWDVRDEIREEEDRQEEAGIGEVVGLEARADALSGGRRR
ncbi:MAG: hypothetical protein M1814_003773 [Vezdaea aestivalis]|nr:MAG: hypothetical protein M1814_003773 [Vezdaea aestivalis]